MNRWSSLPKKRVLKMKKCIIAFFLFSGTPSFAADDLRYEIIIDLRGTESYLHLFEYQTTKTIPKIKELLTLQQTMSSQTLTDLGDSNVSLIPLFDEAIKIAQQKNGANKIPVRILGTGKIRLLSKLEQERIYSTIENRLNDTYHSKITITENRTLPGKLESLYHWLTINYLLNHFEHHSQTVGSVSINASSAEIAFEIKKTARPIDETVLTIDGKNYIVFSKSFLTLGLDQARQHMLLDTDANRCYPPDTPFRKKESGQFNLVICRSIYHQIIENFNIPQQLLPVYKTSLFVAFNQLYDIYHFFQEVPHPPDQETFEQSTIDPICHHPWKTFNEAYPYPPRSLLQNYCGNGIYITDLLYNGFKIHSSQLKMLSTINNQKIDWPLGAIFYEWIHDKP